jgi:hypothetical protein
VAHPVPQTGRPVNATPRVGDLCLKTIGMCLMITRARATRSTPPGHPESPGDRARGHDDHEERPAGEADLDVDRYLDAVQVRRGPLRGTDAMSEQALNGLFWSGSVLFVAVLLINLGRAVWLPLRMASYMERAHPAQYRRIYLDDAVRKAMFWPFMRGTSVDFLWKSDETFGDEQIAMFRAKIKRATTITFVTFVAVFSWFVVAGVILPAVLLK